MPKSVPSVNQQNWGGPLNEHLAQLINPVNGGINVWNDSGARPWNNGDGSRGDFVGYTGLNRSNGRLERWDGSKWEVVGEKISTPYVDGSGTAYAAYDESGDLFIYGDGGADFSDIEVGQSIFFTHQDKFENLGSFSNVQTNEAGKTSEYEVLEVDVANKIIRASFGLYRSNEVLSDSVSLGTVQSSSDDPGGAIYTMAGTPNGLNGVKPGDNYLFDGVFQGGVIKSIDYDNNTFRTVATNDLNGGAGRTITAYRQPRLGTPYRIGQISLNQINIVDGSVNIQIAPLSTNIDRLKIGKIGEINFREGLDPKRIWSGALRVNSYIRNAGETNDAIWRIGTFSQIFRDPDVDRGEQSGIIDKNVINRISNILVRTGNVGLPGSAPTLTLRQDGIHSETWNQNGVNYIDQSSCFSAAQGLRTNVMRNYGFLAGSGLVNLFAGRTTIGTPVDSPYFLHVGGRTIIGATANNNLIANPDFTNNGAADTTNWQFSTGWGANSTPNAANVIFWGMQHDPNAGSTVPLAYTSSPAQANKVYILKLDIKERTQGSVTVEFGGTTFGSRGANGELITLNQTVSNGTLIITPTADFDGIINNVRVHEVKPNNANLHVLGNTGLGTLEPSEKLDVVGNIVASGTITPSSDARLKTNVQPLTNALEKVEALTGVTYDWQDPTRHGNDTGRQVGLIAQDVEKVLPEAVRTRGDEQLKTLNYNGVTGLLVEALKEQQSLIKTQQEQIESLRRRLDTLES